MEFGVLSRVTGDKKYERAAKLSSLELYHRRSRIGLYGRHINSKVGAWTEAMAGVGSHIDSKIELPSYLIQENMFVKVVPTYKAP